MYIELCKILKFYIEQINSFKKRWINIDYSYFKNII